MAAPTLTSVSTTPSAPKRKGWWKTHYPMPGERKEVVGGYLFVAPTTFLLALFYFIPLIQTFYYSFTKWDPISTRGATGVGFANYRNLTSTGDFLGSLGHTFILLVFSVPIGMAVGLALALLLNRPFRGRTVYRILVFIPYIAPMIGTAYIFEYILSPLGGVANGILGSLGFAPINFLAQNPWAMISIIAFTIWYTAGFNMVIYLAALGSVPEVYYEASIVDGASWWARFRHITWPLVWPSTLFLLVIGVINTIQAFTQIFALTAGGPLQSTYTIIYWIYQESFVNLNGGMATAGSVVLFAIGIIVTILQLRFLGRRHQALLG